MMTNNTQTAPEFLMFAVYPERTHGGNVRKFICRVTDSNGTSSTTSHSTKRAATSWGRALCGLEIEEVR